MPHPYAISCHCGRFRAEVHAEPGDLLECNCSTCARTGFLRWLLPLEAVTLKTESIRLSTYLWRDAHGGYHFCPECGVAVLRTGWGDRIAVNARCIEGIDVFTLKSRRYDGRCDMPPGPTR